MGHLLNVRDRTALTDEMFEPLKQTIDLLKSYDHEMSEEVHQQLQVSSDKIPILGPGPDYKPDRCFPQVLLYWS